LRWTTTANIGGALPGVAAGRVFGAREADGQFRDTYIRWNSAEHDVALRSVPTVSDLEAWTALSPRRRRDLRPEAAEALLLGVGRGTARLRTRPSTTAATPCIWPCRRSTAAMQTRAGAAIARSNRPAGTSGGEKGHAHPVRRVAATARGPRRAGQPGARRGEPSEARMVPAGPAARHPTPRL